MSSFIKLTRKGLSFLMKKYLEIKTLVTASFFCALIFLATYILKMSFPGIKGFFNLGDGFILLGAAILPVPFSAIAAGLGAGLADLASGFGNYILPTFIIKFTMTFFISYRQVKILSIRNILGGIGAEIFMILGYYASETIMYSSYLSPLSGIPLNIAQAVGGVIIFVVAGPIFDKINIKNRMYINH